MHHLMGLVPPDQSALSLGRPLCVRRGSRGLQNQTGPLPHHAWAGRRETTGPRLARLGSGAREAHRVLGTNLGPTGGLVGGMSKTAMQPRGAPKSYVFDVARARASTTCTI